MFACCFFAGFNNCYDAELFEELKKVLLYVKGHIDFKQVYCVEPGSKLELTFVCDADYSGDRPSTFGGLGWLNDCMIYAHSSTIKTAVTSSTESEAHSIFEFTKMGIYCANWITELVGYVLRPVYVFNDNASAILILTTRTNSSKSKHFNIKLRYVNFQHEQKNVKVAFIPRELNGADMLTHPLSAPSFEKMIDINEGSTTVFHLGGDLNTGPQVYYTFMGFYDPSSNSCIPVNNYQVNYE